VIFHHRMICTGLLSIAIFLSQIKNISLYPFITTSISVMESVISCRNTIIGTSNHNIISMCCKQYSPLKPPRGLGLEQLELPFFLFRLRKVKWQCNAMPIDGLVYSRGSGGSREVTFHCQPRDGFATLCTLGLSLPLFFSDSISLPVQYVLGMKGQQQSRDC
jgi:hypothetical protein